MMLINASLMSEAKAGGIVIVGIDITARKKWKMPCTRARRSTGNW